MRSWRTKDERALLEAARESPRAFAEFYEHFETPVLRFFARATAQSEVVADLTAETFARALESMALYDPMRGRADQWLFGIARNVLADSYRRGRVDSAARQRLGMPTLSVDDHTIETIARLSAEEASVTLALALAALPTEQRTAIHARVVQEREYAEIAVDLECSEAVVRQRVSRGLRALRTRLASER